MPSELRDVTCPGCGQAFPLHDADSLSVAGTEMECPHCGRALAVDAEDHLTAEDEEADHELFTLDAEGELSAETLLAVRCPRCGCAHESGEAGVTCCPRCRHLVPLDERGRVDDGRVFHYDCSRCGSLLEGPGPSPGGEDERCQACGWYDASEEWLGPSEEEEIGVFCPNCGDGIGLSEERIFLSLQPNGCLRCQLCQWEFPPPAGANLDWLAEYPEAEEISLGFNPEEHNRHNRVLVVAADGSGDYRRIQDAVAAPHWGCSLRVRPGCYEEALVLLRPVEILADGPPGSVEINGGKQTCVRIECGEVTLRGLRLRSEDMAVEVQRGQPLLEECTLHSSGSVAVLVSASAAVPVLRRCQIESGQVGVQIEGRGLARLEECVVQGGTVSVEVIEGGRLEAWSCRFWGPGECQVCVRTSCDATLADCELTGSLAGVCVGGGRVRLERCRVHDCRGTGVFVQAGMVTLEECRLDHQGGVGLAVRARGKALLSRCRLEENRDNLVLSGRGVALLEGCELGSHAGVSVSVRGHARPHLRRCRLDGGRHALWIGPTAEIGLEDCTLSEQARAGCAMMPGGRIRWIRPGRS